MRAIGVILLESAADFLKIKEGGNLDIQILGWEQLLPYLPLILVVECSVFLVSGSDPTVNVHCHRKYRRGFTKCPHLGSN